MPPILLLHSMPSVAMSIQTTTPLLPTTLLAPRSPVYLGQVNLDSGCCLIGEPMAFDHRIPRSTYPSEDHMPALYSPTTHEALARIAAEELQVFMVENDIERNSYELRAFPHWECRSDAELAASTYNAAQMAADHAGIEDESLQQISVSETRLSEVSGAVVLVDSWRAATHAINDAAAADRPHDDEVLRVVPSTWTPSANASTTLNVYAVGAFHMREPVKFYRITVASTPAPVVSAILPFLDEATCTSAREPAEIQFRTPDVAELQDQQ
jgi:hypothetical protein